MDISHPMKPSSVNGGATCTSHPFSCDASPTCPSPPVLGATLPGYTPASTAQQRGGEFSVSHTQKPSSVMTGARAGMVPSHQVFLGSAGSGRPPSYPLSYQTQPEVVPRHLSHQIRSSRSHPQFIEDPKLSVIAPPSDRVAMERMMTMPQMLSVPGVHNNNISNAPIGGLTAAAANPYHAVNDQQRFLQLQLQQLQDQIAMQQQQLRQMQSLRPQDAIVGATNLPQQTYDGGLFQSQYPVGAAAGLHQYIPQQQQPSYLHMHTAHSHIHGHGHLHHPQQAPQQHAQQQPQRPPVDTRVWGYAVCDPHHPFLQRVPIPPSVCSVTKGLLCYNNDVQASSARPCVSTVCVAYTNKDAPTCPQGEACPHFHVDREYLLKARSVVEPLCCAYHNDYYSREVVEQNSNPSVLGHRYALLLEDKSGIEISPAFLALTVGLDALPTKGKGTAACKYISVRKHLCRLHLEGKCKWTKDCSHVHICREVYRHILGTPRQSLLNILTSADLSPNAIAERIISTPSYVTYIRSPAALPLASWVIDGAMPTKKTVLEALLIAGGLLSEDQAAVAKRVFGFVVPVQQIAPVPHMLRRFFKPQTAIPEQGYICNQSSHSSTRTPTLSGDNGAPTLSAASNERAFTHDADDHDELIEVKGLEQLLESLAIDELF